MKNALLSIGLLACLVAGFTTSRVLPALPSANAAAAVRVPVSASVILPSTQCQGRTLAGNRCRRKTTAASGYCYQHAFQAERRTAWGWSVL